MNLVARIDTWQEKRDRIVNPQANLLRRRSLNRTRKGNKLEEAVYSRSCCAIAVTACQWSASTTTHWRVVGMYPWYTASKRWHAYKARISHAPVSPFLTPLPLRPLFAGISVCWHSLPGQRVYQPRAASSFCCLL